MYWRGLSRARAGQPDYGERYGPGARNRKHEAGVGALTFSAQLFLAGFVIDNSKKAKSLDGDVAIGIGMNQRFSLWHQNPVLALLVRRQTGARRRRQAQRAIGNLLVNVMV